MNSANSMLVAFDGESKCGKTTIIDAVAKEAHYQANLIPGILQKDDFESLLGEKQLQALQHVQTHTFDRISTISAGNMFRAAAYLAHTEERQGRPISHFSGDDADRLREILSRDGIYDTLQNDPAIGSRVSLVGKMAGVQALCGTLFCDAVVEAYGRNDSKNLVIVDARDPVGHLQRNNAIGAGRRQIHPASILPIYIETPAEIAAQRMGGSYDEQLEKVRQRRQYDAEREELPCKKPQTLISDYTEWLSQFIDPSTQYEAATPFEFKNDAQITLDHVQFFAGKVAAAAQDISIILGNHHDLVSV